MKKVLIVFLAMLFQSSYADFWKEGRDLRDGWVYNDHGDHKARTHVITALEQALEDIRIAGDIHDDDDYPDEVHPFTQAAHRIQYIKSTIINSLRASGIGEAEEWTKCICKFYGHLGGGFFNPAAGLLREIEWVKGSDPGRGIWLHFTKNQWHCDHR